MAATTITSERLELVVAAPEQIHAAIRGAESLAASLEAAIPSDWPHEYIDRNVLDFFAEHAKSDEGKEGWWLRFVLLKQGTARRLIGTAGFKGPPTKDGMVEIGYGLVASERRKGYATEAARALIAHAMSSGSVSYVTASTLSHLSTSIGVLHRAGFHLVARTEDGRVLRYSTRPS